MTKLPRSALPVGLGVVLFLVAGFAAGSAFRSDDPSPRSGEAPLVAQSQPDEVPGLSAVSDGSTIGDPGKEEPEATRSLQVDPLWALRDLHEKLVQENGFIASGSLDSESLAVGFLSLDAPELLWTANGSGLPIEGNRLTAKIPAGIDLAFLSQEAASASTVVAVGGDSQLLAVGLVDAAGSFLATHTPAGLSLGLSLGGEELFRFQYSPRTADPCDSIESPNYESPLHAIVSYLDGLGSQTELAMERAEQETEARVQETWVNAGSFTDPVTGIVVQASLADIKNQLDAGTATKDVDVRAAIPVEIQLLSEEKANAHASQIMVFIDQANGNVLGAFPLGMQSSDPTTEESFDTAILEIAPPQEGADVTVVVRDEAERETWCALVDDKEDTLIIPYDDIAGRTRVSISVADNTYSTISSFELSN